MALEDGIEQRFLAIERDIRGLEADTTYARDQRGRLWDHVTALEKDMVALTKDMATCKQLAGEAAENSAATRTWVEAREKEAAEAKRVTRGQFWAIVAVVVMLLAAMSSAAIGIIQLTQGP